MRLLAIDTATEACSAALYIDGEVVSEYQLAPREHSRLILKMIDKLLSDSGFRISDLDAIAYGCGPGSFMGLRIAAGVVQGIAFAHDIPVISISTLKAIAQRAYEETSRVNILVAIDARMDEVYWCPYSLQPCASEAGAEAGHWRKVAEECVISPDSIDLDAVIGQVEGQWVGAGTGWGSYAHRLLRSGMPKPDIMLEDCLPSAENIVKLAVKELEAGNTVSAAQAVPVYLRNDVAKKPKPIVI
jgi:tRNA threonylcarbamoyladenosine biosynthesis protein TsaB